MALFHMSDPAIETSRNAVLAGNRRAIALRGPFAGTLIGVMVRTLWAGARALVLAVTLILLAFRLRKHRRERCSGAVAAPI
jgi:hypothetical protein